MYGLAGGNRYGRERRMDGKGLKIAHKGVRSDDGVEVTEASE